MKKIISLILVVCILCTMGVVATFTVVAETSKVEETVLKNEVVTENVATIDEGETVAITFANDGVTTTENIAVGANLPIPEKLGATFLGWYDANGVKVLTATADTTVAAAWLKKVDLTKTVKISGGNGNITVMAPTTDEKALNVKTQGYANTLIDPETGAIKTSNVWTGGTAISLKYPDDTFVDLAAGYKYIVNVEYDVNFAPDAEYLPKIAIVYNNNTATSNALKDNGTVILNAKTHAETVSDATISYALSNVNANALRIAFDGVGQFIIKSVSVYKIPKNADDIAVVKFVDSAYSIDKMVVSEKGAALVELPRTLSDNFGGWYNGDKKVTIANNGDVLRAKWFNKADVNMDGVVNNNDLLAIKLAVTENMTDVVYDVDRDNKVTSADVTFLRKILLNVPAVLIGGNNILSYKLDENKLPFFMTTEATDLLATTLKEFCGLDIINPSKKAVNNIVIGVPVSKNDFATSTLTTLTGVNGDTYGVDDYKIFVYNNNLYIEGGSDYATAYAVNKFISFIKKYEIIPVGYELSGQYNGEKNLDGYYYVWGDEFNGELLDRSKWLVETQEVIGPLYSLTDKYYYNTRNDRPWQYNSENKKLQDGVIKYLDDEGNNFYLEDGALVMNTKATEYGYSATKISSKYKYNFTYGIMTARVKLATKNGASSTFWSRSLDDIGGEGASVNEMDFVENYGTEQIRPNLHTWENYTDHINHDGKIDYQENLFAENGESFSDEYHEITLYWTKDKIIFYFDGVKYLEQDIASDSETWEAFHKSTYLIMGVSAPSGNYANNFDGVTPGDKLGTMVNSFSENLCMDYIRVYQK